MNKKINTQKAFEIWKTHLVSDQDHLSMQRLYELSLTDGLKHAREYEIEHLSLCPHCLDTWEAFCPGAKLFLEGDYASDDYSIGEYAPDDYPVDDYDEEQDILSCGFLKAASTGFSEPLYIKSDCKKFMLGIFPEIDSPGSGMAVLETIDETSSHDGMEASILDARGEIVLKNRIKHGRAASKIDNLDKLDLSKWTLVLRNTGQQAKNE
ncbi:MAG: hypothetical protein PF503_21590 [Desulfobacula sp.]|jgi:hypothetical protein|nr:hypothetical protein [Desulfobacula sp.]